MAKGKGDHLAGAAVITVVVQNFSGMLSAWLHAPRKVDTTPHPTGQPQSRPVNPLPSFCLSCTGLLGAIVSSAPRAVVADLLLDSTLLDVDLHTVEEIRMWHAGKCCRTNAGVQRQQEGTTRASPFYFSSSSSSSSFLVTALAVIHHYHLLGPQYFPGRKFG